jgi:hypothetical protein
MDCTQLLLNTVASSGRGVRYHTLSPAEVDRVNADAARLVDPTTGPVEYRSVQIREGIKRMLVAVTKRTGIVSQDELLALTTADWEPLEPRKLEAGMGAFSYDTLFTAKDDAILAVVYRQLHEVTLAEVQAILGKALTVSVG